MGLRMANIHSPSVASGERAAGGSSSRNPDDDLSLQELIAKKDGLESELSALGAVLQSHGVNMNTGLTTFDGFPRADVDVAQIRTTRARIIHLRNDVKSLMTRIEAGLHAHFAATAPTTTATTANGTLEGSASQDIRKPSSQDPPFAQVNGVVANSPAELAGLKVNDRIQKFGEANWLNHEKLSKVAQIVSANEGRSINVVVLRNSHTEPSEQEVQISLVPRRDWGGRGLLGCHLVPL